MNNVILLTCIVLASSPAVATAGYKNAHLICQELLTAPLQNSREDAAWLDQTALPRIDDARAAAMIHSGPSLGEHKVLAIEAAARKYQVQLPDDMRFVDTAEGRSSGVDFIALGPPGALAAFLKSVTERNLIVPARTSILIQVDANLLPALNYGGPTLALGGKSFRSELDQLINGKRKDASFMGNADKEGYLFVRLPFDQFELYRDVYSSINGTESKDVLLATEALEPEFFYYHLRRVHMGEIQLILTERNQPRAALISFKEFDAYWAMAHRQTTREVFPHRALNRYLRERLIRHRMENAADASENDLNDIAPLLKISARAPAVERANPVAKPRRMSRTVFLAQRGYAQFADSKSPFFLDENRPLILIIQGEKGKIGKAAPLAVVMRADFIRAQGARGAEAAIQKIVDETKDVVWRGWTDEIEEYVGHLDYGKRLPLSAVKRQDAEDLLTGEFKRLQNAEGQDIYLILPFDSLNP